VDVAVDVVKMEKRRKKDGEVEKIRGIVSVLTQQADIPTPHNTHNTLKSSLSFRLDTWSIPITMSHLRLLVYSVQEKRGFKTSHHATIT
jgi:hypothetical protein